MTTRAVNGDEHYGQIGFGSMTQSGTNAFSTARLPAIAEPDIIIRDAKNVRNTLDFDIDEILVWDNRGWTPHVNFGFLGAAAEDITQNAVAGITKDNSAEATEAPTAFTVGQGVFPGGSGAAVTGTAGVDGAAPMVGQEIPRFEAFFDYGNFANDENAVGEINMSGVDVLPKTQTEYKQYEVDGNNVHKMMTAAHYHVWLNTVGTGGARTISLGAEVRRMSVDLEEVLFDRAVLLSILDALLIVQ